MNINNSEQKLMEIIWNNEPIKSGDLVRICFETYDWKKSTVYTILKKLTLKNAVKSENAVVTALIMRENALSEQSENVIESRFGGSLPMFLTAFLSKEKLSVSEAKQLKQLIDNYTEVEK